MTEFTFMDAIAEDMNLEVKKHGAEFLNVEIRLFDENDELVFREIVHEAAWSSLVQLSRQVLLCQKNLEIDELLEE